MLNNFIINSIVISIIYFLIKFLEMRFIEQETKPLKDLIKNTTFVFISSMMGGFLLEQFKFNNILKLDKEDPKVFTNEPGF